MSSYCEVVVPVPLRQSFYYRIPEPLKGEITPGKRLEVPFGPRQVIGYCVSLCEENQIEVDFKRIREVQKVLDPVPLLSQALLELTRWICEHYLCPWVDVLQAALPAPTRLGRARAQTYFVSLKKGPDESTKEKLEKRSPKQALILDLLRESQESVEKKILLKLAQASNSSLKALEKHGYISMRNEESFLDPLEGIEMENQTPPKLNADQQKVWQEFNQKRQGVYLLRGVTGSGKTEIYLRAIEQTIKEGQQAIVLVPEISLTPQTLRRFKARFSKLAVLHSRLTDAQRAQQWSQIHQGQADVIIGARSALFSPAPHLGLIIVDEEHDSSFKQQNSPRYNARDLAIMRGHIEKIPVILGSATPQIESWFNVSQGKSQLLSLPRRISDLPLPPVSVLDMTLEVDKEGQIPMISRKTLLQLDQCRQQGKQAMLLLNRRGFSPVLKCARCSHIPRCPSCDIALTTHHQLYRLICHYCHHTQSIPKSCSKCQHSKLHPLGAGTQRIEKILLKLLPDLKILRMDADSTRGRDSHNKILKSFRNQEADVLIGTQMIAKGHDFPNVSFVAVLNADVGLTLPDFRSPERIFSLITQVAGRAGRKDDDGRVLIQTTFPHHYAIEKASQHDIEGFIENELALREPFRYPPFGRLARILIHGPNLEHVNEASLRFQKKLTPQNKVEILGPAPCPLTKINDRYRQHILLKAPRHDLLHQTLKKCLEHPPHYEEIRFLIDIDPLSLL